MAVSLKIFDQINSIREPALTLELVSERITVKDLIERRIKAEVSRHNEIQPKLFQGLIQPTDTEVALNGYRFNKAKRLNWQEQVNAALKGFTAGQIYLLIDDRQVEDLDEELIMANDTEVIFLKLVPLIGG